MKVDIVTIFPDFFRGPLDYGIVRRAREFGLVEIAVHDLRAFAHDRHRTVDDRPFGGGEGMVLKPEPIFECMEALDIAPRDRRRAARQSAVLLSAQGKRFDQRVAEELSALERIVLICGRYEGVDERVGEHLADHELSIGDYVLSGGELGAAVILDAMARLIPGAARQPSLDPARVVQHARASASGGRTEFHLRRGRTIGLSALHPSRGVPRDGGAGSADFRQSRRNPPLAPPHGAREDLRNRPDLVDQAALSEEDKKLLAQIVGETDERKI